jgi:hypothetical protein
MQPTAKRTKHGLVGTPTYISWRGMKERCLRPKHSQYKDYGGRGVKICTRWTESFEAFLEDMGPRPPATSIERRDNSLGYQPGNCYWATRKQQARNKRNNRLITANGETKTLAEWAEITGLSYATIITRLDRQKWTPEDALTKPPDHAAKSTNRHLTYAGLTMTIASWARKTGQTASGLRARLDRINMTVEQALLTPNMRPRKKS